MATLDLRQRVLEYVKNADNRFLRLVKAMADNYNDDDDRITIEQYDKELEASEKEIESGSFHTQDQLRQIIDGWEKE
ncbi:MAG TPA: hypothetical protein VLZ54_13285 [Arenibacter sp.]|nr:hypothetical protein [Arenibacter sp.]